jgi:hypothetical protein
MAQKQEDKSQPKTTTNSAVQARPKASAQIDVAAAAFWAQSSKPSFVSLHVQLPSLARVPRSQLLHSAHVGVNKPERTRLWSAATTCGSLEVPKLGYEQIVSQFSTVERKF